MTAPAEARKPPEGLIHRGLGRVELFDLPPEKLAGLADLRGALAAEGRTGLSFHCPVVRPEWFPWSGVTCFFLNDDPAKRELSFRLLADTLEHAARHGAEYVVSHLTFGPTDTRDPVLATELAAAACERMAVLSRGFDVPIDVEFAAYTDSFHDPAAFVAAVGRHPYELGLCIDVGHTFIGASRRGRDYHADIATLAPLARSMHLWNCRDPASFAHVPLHPSQRPADGWIDVEAAIHAVLTSVKDSAFIFEYPIKAITPEIRQGYDWVAAIVDRVRG